MKTYRARLKEGAKGVYGISLVDKPAMEGDFIQFSKQEPVKFAKVEGDKFRVMGLVLEPNKLVYRNQGGEEFNIVFKEDDIKDVAYNFQKQGNQNNSTIQHDGKLIEGVSFVESWLIADEKLDKSVKYGFNYPVGSWVAVMELENQEIIDDYVKTGKVKGFSIDAMMSFEEVNLNKVDMNEKSVLELLKDLPSQFAKALKLNSDTEVKEEEVVEEVKAEAEAKEEIVEEVKVVAEAEEVKVEEPVALSKEDVSSMIEKAVELALEPYKKETVELKEAKEKLEKENVELSKQPATKSISSAPKQLSYADMTPRQKMQYNIENK